MARRWQIIDEDGSRDVVVDHENGRVRSGVKVSHEHSDWPAFTQFAVRAEVDALRSALREVAREFDLPCSEIDADGEPTEHTIEFARRGELVFLGEPGVDFEDRFVTAASSEALVEQLETDGIHYGHDPSSGSLHLTRFEGGVPRFTWCDSLRPGPSFALTFHPNGQCTEQDPRSFALQRLERAGQQTCLDRRAFVRSELESFGIERVDPDFSTTPSESAFAIETDSYRTPMLS